MATDPAHPQAQGYDLADSTDDNSFRFTPIKAIRALPRLWERKPSTPFKGGLKPRKLWKRFQTSFSNMQTLQDTTASIRDDAFQTAINATRDSNYVRGTKRMRVDSDEKEHSAEASQPSKAFFETKWDSEARKKRKLPDFTFDIFNDQKQEPPTFVGSQVDGSTDTTDVDQGHVDSQNTGSLAAEQVTTTADEQGPAVAEAPIEATVDTAPTPTKAVRALTQEQQGKLVRSALRSSLDGEDAELLNDFLSKAKAKRAAKATLVNPQESDVDVNEKSSSSDDSPDAENATPRQRRALGDLDTNSPSPVKIQVSPVKGEMILEDAIEENDVEKSLASDEQAPASPTCRRSSRVKAPPVNVPSARNTISLRRAKGTEFVFLQKTEAQELALATKRNTRNNRGQSVMPKYALAAMEQQSEVSEAPESDRPGRKGRKGSKNRQSRKNVSWNEKRLAEYEDEMHLSESQEPEEVDISKDDVGGTSARARAGAKQSENNGLTSSRNSRSQVQNGGRDNVDVESGPTTTSAAPRSRRMRRVGESTMTSGTPVKTGSGRISKPPVGLNAAAASEGPSTPTKGRRKLNPKSPSSSVLATGVPKSSDQSFVSGIPVASEGPRRKSMLEASAGCTPMPKRVRART